MTEHLAFTPDLVKRDITGEVFFCPTCLASYPWKHEQAPAWLIWLRRIRQLVRGRVSVRIDWA